MTRRVRIRLIGLAALLVGAGLWASASPLGDALARAVAAQWRLDLDRAMDVVGIVPGMVVGEAGAGDGYFTIPMARRVGAEGVVYANDISRRALRSLERQSAREGLTNVHAVVGEVADPLFPRRDLEIVVVVHALHDFARPVEWLVNAKKYLRPGGTLAIVDRDPAQGGGAHFWPRERIERYAGEAGYELVRSADDVSAHLILVFRPVS